MAFKLVSKNNIGILTTLILVILLSQSRFFNFLTDTPLGRITLLAFVIFIAYTNHILGLIAVLCIVVSFNNNINIVSGYNLYEGLENINEDKKDDKSAKNEPVDEEQKNLPTKKINFKPKKINLKNKLSGREGFCMTERETNMLRGKQSNSISIYNSREQSDNVSPSDKSVFTSDYETF